MHHTGIPISPPLLDRSRIWDHQFIAQDPFQFRTGIAVAEYMIAAGKNVNSALRIEPIEGSTSFELEKVHPELAICEDEDNADTSGGNVLEFPSQIVSQASVSGR